MNVGFQMSARASTAVAWKLIAQIEKSLGEEILQGSGYAWRCNSAKQTKETVCLSRLPCISNRTVLWGACKKTNSDYEKFSRDKQTQRRYGRAWKRIRDKYAAEHPFCEKCYEHGFLVPVEEVHHKLPLSEGGTHDRSNLIALCKSCHSQIHAKRGDRWHNHWCV